MEWVGCKLTICSLAQSLICRFSWNACRRYQIRGRYKIGNQGCCAAMGDVCASVCLTCALVQQDAETKDRISNQNEPVSEDSLQLDSRIPPCTHQPDSRWPRCAEALRTNDIRIQHMTQYQANSGMQARR